MRLFWPLFLQIYSDFPELYSEQLVTSQKTPDLVLGLFKSLTVIAFMLQHPIPNFWGNSTAVLTVIFADIFRLSWIIFRITCKILGDIKYCHRFIPVLSKWCFHGFKFTPHLIWMFWPLILLIYSDFPRFASAQLVAALNISSLVPGYSQYS